MSDLIGMLTFTPEVKRITFNADQVRAVKAEIERLTDNYNHMLVRIAELEAVLMTESEKCDLLSKEHYRDRIAELEAEVENLKGALEDHGVLGEDK